MNHISLFSGMGGFDLAAEWMGWQNIAHCEWNEFGRRILKHYWSEAASHEDITKTDFTVYRGQCDILTGGFPCQPFSHAGKRKGTTDARYLWPEMLRAITEAQPRYVIGENVTGITSMAFEPRASKVESETTIDGQNHYRTLEAEGVLHRICTDLEREGYQCQPLIIPACAVNAPHRRDRIWIIGIKNDTNTTSERLERRTGQSVQGRSDGPACGSNERPTANTNGERCTPCRTGAEIEGCGCGNNGQPNKRGKQAERFNGPSGLLRPTANTNGTEPRTTNAATTGSTQSDVWRHQACDVPGTLCSARNATNANQPRLDRRHQHREEKRTEQKTRVETFGKPTSWQSFPTQPPVCAGNDGLPTKMDNITIPKWRKESLKAAGNAIVPQVALEIFKAIQQMENQNQ